MKKVSVIGLFCNGISVADGQSVKTRIVTEELENIWMEEKPSKLILKMYLLGI